MPESKLPSDAYRNSDAPSTQELGSQIVELRIPGGDSDSSESSTQLSTQLRITDIVPAGGTAYIDKNTVATDVKEFIDDDKSDGSEMIDIAISLMAESKAGLPLSNLNNAIFLFREVIDSLPTTHPLHNEAKRDLASALAVRFMYTDQVPDLMESFTLRSEIPEARWILDQETSHETNTTLREDETATQETLELAKALLSDFRKSVSLDTLNNIIFLVQESLVHISDAPPRRFLALTTLADGLYARFNHSYDMSDLNDATSSLQDAIKCCTERDRQQSAISFRISGVLGARFDLIGDISDLLMARYWLENGNIIHAESSAGILESLQFATELLEQFTTSGDTADLNTSVTLFREGIAELPQEDKNYAACVDNLANALLTRFRQVGQQSDLDDAISLHRQALELRLPPHPLRSASLNNLAAALLTLFEQRGQQSDLDDAISLHRQALGLRLAPHPGRSMSLNNLATALSTRFEQGGQRSDLDDAISLHRQALELRLAPHPLRSASLHNLASALSTRFEQGGQRSDLDDAISLHRQALELFPPPHPDRSASLNNLASALSTRFEQGGQRSDLDDAISLHRQALELRLAPHPGRSMSLHNLATALSTRFKQDGQRSDLDDAISLHRQALELFPPPHPDRSSSLNNLATALSTRFKQGGQRSDLDEAISLHRQALDLRLAPHPLRSTLLNNLASALATRFEQGGQRSDLDDAISLHRQALELLPPPHPNRSGSLNNLANALSTRFEQGGQRSDLDEAISLHKQALELRLAPHPDRSALLNNLANALWTRFEQGGQQSNLDDAISLHRQALELFPSPNPNRSVSLYNLANALSTRLGQQGQNKDIDEAMSLFSTATQYSFQVPSHRLRIARSWIHSANKHQHDSAIDAYEASLHALPLVAALSMDVESRQDALAAGTDGLARDASRCAILSGNIEKAVEFLEAGRSIFWSQVLSLRSPFDQLHKIAPKLANELQDIANDLEVASHRQIFAEMLDNQKKLSIDQEASRLNRLNEKWVRSIQEVRKLSGFEDFLRPLRLSILKSAASEHPLVILIANEDESHCLVMTSTIIHHIPLPTLHTPMLKELVSLIQIAVSQFPISRSVFDQTRDPILKFLGEERGMRYERNGDLGSSDDIFKFVLSILWQELVNPVIHFLNIEKSDGMPVQWCPTGYFTFLPIHAAGLYHDKFPIDCAPDYFISTYTPTIEALLSRDSARATQPFQMMTVIQSSGLPSTRRELANIRKHVPNEALVELGVPGVSAQVETVASRLPEMSIVHFACHGKQDPFKPLDSGLKLDDGLLKISRIMQEKMPNGSLAFLCACETAMGDKKLPDEAMSLAASLIFSGFRRVVATMWEMMDEDGPTIADAFYEELFRGPDGKQALEPDVTKSALALHLAVKKLRSQGVSFRRWVPFIHMGK